MKLVGFLLLALLALTAAASPDAPPQALDGKLMLRNGSESLHQPLSLNGSWHFFPGRWISPAQLSTAAPEAATTMVPGTWQPDAAQQGLQRGIGTYWLELVVAKALTQPSALHFQRLCGASEVYVFRDDGHATAVPLQRLGQPGLNNDSEVIAGGDLLATLPPLQAGLYHVLVQQSNFHLRAGGLCGSVTFGDATVQTHARSLNIVKNAVIVTLLLGLALGSLLLGSQNGERAAPWLALMCAACAALIVATGGLLDTLLMPESFWLQRGRFLGVYSAIAWLPVALIMLFRHTFSIALPRSMVALNIFVPALLTLLFVVVPSLFVPYPKALIAVWWLQLLVAGWVLLNACRERRQYSWLALLACTPLLLTMPYDFHRYFSDGVIEILSPYAIAFLSAVHGGIYTLRFGAAYQLAARLSAHLQEEVELRTRELREKNYKLEQTQIALQKANETLKQLSITDGLTRVHNRMYFEQQFEKEWRRCARQGMPLSILMIDADHFKQLNDSAGHLVGDLCLQAIAKEIERHFKRSGELVARYGGEEFIVLLPDTSYAKALAAGESLRGSIEQLPIEHESGGQLRVTVSIGVSTTVPAIDQQPSQLIATADAALYEAKDSGRNRVHSIPLVGPRAVMAQQQLHL